MMVRPASRTSVFKPFSVSSFAAHPPVMPEPTMIASYDWFAMCPLRLFLDHQRNTTMKGAGYDLQVELLAESDLRGVIPMERNALENVPEIPDQLLVPLFRYGVAMARTYVDAVHHGVVITRPQ